MRTVLPQIHQHGSDISVMNAPFWRVRRLRVLTQLFDVHRCQSSLRPDGHGVAGRLPILSRAPMASRSSRRADPTKVQGFVGDILDDPVHITSAFPDSSSVPTFYS